MDAGEVDFRFPVMGITSDRDLWGFPDLDRLTKCGPQTVKDNDHSSMELIDLEGQRWRVLSVKRLGPVGSLWQQILQRLLYASPQSRIALELESLTPVSLDEVKARACAGLDAFPGYWCADDVEPEPELSERKAALKAATSIQGLHDLLELDTFEAY